VKILKRYLSIFSALKKTFCVTACSCYIKAYILIAKNVLMAKKLSKSQENLDEVSKISNLLMESQIAF